MRIKKIGKKPIKIIGKSSKKEYLISDKAKRRGGTAIIHFLNQGFDNYVLKSPNLDNKDSRDFLKNEISLISKHPEMVEHFVEEATLNGDPSLPCFITRDLTFENYKFLDRLIGITSNIHKKQIFSSKPLDLFYNTYLVKEIAKELKKIHETGYCHTDIDPRNIAVDQETGLVRIIDFGIARRSTQQLKYIASGYQPTSASKGYDFNVANNEPHKNKFFCPPEFDDNGAVTHKAVENMDTYMLMEIFTLMSTTRITKFWKEKSVRENKDLEELLITNMRINKSFSDSKYQEIAELIVKGTSEISNRFQNCSEIINAVNNLDLDVRNNFGLIDAVPTKFYVPEFDFKGYTKLFEEEASKRRIFSIFGKKNKGQPVENEIKEEEKVKEVVATETYLVPVEANKEQAEVNDLPAAKYIPPSKSSIKPKDKIDDDVDDDDWIISAEAIAELNSLGSVPNNVSKETSPKKVPRPKKLPGFFSRQKDNLLAAATVVGVSLALSFGGYYAGNQVVKCYKEYEKSAVEACQAERRRQRPIREKEKLRPRSNNRITPHSDSYDPIVIEVDLNKTSLEEQYINSNLDDYPGPINLEDKLQQNPDDSEVCIDKDEIKDKIGKAFETDLNSLIEDYLLNGGEIIVEEPSKIDEGCNEKVAVKKYLKFSGKNEFEFNEDTLKKINLKKLFSSNLRGKRKYNKISCSEHLEDCEIFDNHEISDDQSAILAIRGDKNYYSYSGDLENVVIEVTQEDLTAKASLKIKIKPVNDLPVATDKKFSKIHIPAYNKKNYRTSATVDLKGHFTDVDDAGKLKYFITLGKDSSTANEIVPGKDMVSGKGKNEIKISLEDNLLTIYSSKKTKNASLKIIASDGHGKLSKMPSKNIDFNFYGPKEFSCSFVDDANEKYVVIATALNKGLAEQMGYDDVSSCLEHNYPNLSEIANSICVSAEIFQKREQVKPFKDGKVSLIIDSNGKVVLDDFDMKKEYVTRFEEIFENTIMGSKVSTTGFENTCLRLVINNRYTENKKEISKENVEHEEKKREESKSSSSDLMDVCEDAIKSQIYTISCINTKSDSSVIEACGDAIGSDSYTIDCIKANSTPSMIKACGEAIGSDTYKVECIETKVDANTIEACGDAISSDSYKVECIETKVDANTIEACGDAISSDSYKIECIETKANTNTIEACGDAISSDTYKIECIEIGANEDLISKCKDTYSSDVKIVQCIKERKEKRVESL